MDQMSFKQEVIEGKNRIIDKTKTGLSNAGESLKSNVKRARDKEEAKRFDARTKAIIKPLVMSDDERSILADEALEARLQHRIVTAKNEAVEKEDKFGIKFDPDYGDLTEQVKKYELGEDPFTGSERRKMISEIKKHEMAYGDPKVFIDQYKIDFARMNSDQRRAYSEDYLRKRYEDNKKYAENEAKEKGIEPKYDDWTKERVEREEKGKPLFTDKEISSLSENIRHSEKSGEDIQKTLGHTIRNSTNIIKPETEKMKPRVEIPEPPIESSNVGLGSERINNNASINVNHTHSHEHSIHDNLSSDQTIDIKKVRNDVEQKDKSSDKKSSESKTAEVVLKSINEVIKNQHEEKKDLDETQEQLKDLQKTIEQKNRAVNAKINKLEGEKTEETEE